MKNTFRAASVPVLVMGTAIEAKGEACSSIPRRRNRSRSHVRSLGQSRCVGALLGTCRRDRGGKSGRRPGRHLQVEASGPGNAAGVRQRLAGRSRGGEIAQGRTCAVWVKVDAPELSSGPVCEIEEVSRAGAQGVTSNSMLLAEASCLPVDSEVAKLLLHFVCKCWLERLNAARSSR